MFKKLMVGVATIAFSATAMAQIATFDWAEASSSSWWSNAGYVETDNGVTMTSAGRAFTSGTGAAGVAMRAQYWQDVDPAIFSLSQDVAVQSFDIRWSGNLAGVPNGWFGIYGRLDGAPVWEYIPGVNDVDTGWQTISAATTGNMGDMVDEIQWYIKYDGANPSTILTWENNMDNLVVAIPEPATLGLLGLAGLAVYVKRRIS